MPCRHHYMMTKSLYSNLFTNKIILAPMVRANSLPFRLLCLQMGADLVYTEELVDYRLSACKRLENKALGTIDFVDESGKAVFRTCSLERDRVVLQLGSNNPERALKAAQLVCEDVLAIDFNFGCPKSFSISGGMGAALLTKPDQIKSLLTTCINNLHIPVTCKIRILPQLDATLELVKLIESCGISAIAVHGRTKDQRPHHENQNDTLKIIAENIEVPMIANGYSNHIKCYSDMINFKNITKASSVMIARAALRNPSIFKPCENMPSPVNPVITEYLKLAIKYDNPPGNSKYVLQIMMAGAEYDGCLLHKLRNAGDFETICRLFNLEKWYNENKPTIKKTDFYEEDLEELINVINETKKALKLANIEYVDDYISYSPKFFGRTTPRSVLMEYVNKKACRKPEFNSFLVGKRSFYCLVKFENRCYLNKAHSGSKKNSENASALVICDRLNLIDLNNYSNTNIKYK